MDELSQGSVRQLVWFSCGAASAVAAKLMPDAEVLYCDTLAYEHPDNKRFMDDVSCWIGRPIRILKSSDYADIYDVFRKTRWLIGVKGARCTTELKKNVRKAYQRVDDIQGFGFTSDEQKRIEKFKRENPEVNARFPLMENDVSKDECYAILANAGIELPVMYRMGYRNNNCIGCVKGGKGYWNKIRRDFPEVFAKMSAMERELDAAICKNEGVTDGKRWRKRVFLDELPPDAGRYQEEPDIECGVVCTTEGYEDNGSEK